MGDHTTAAQKIPLWNVLRKLKNEMTTEMRQPKAKHSKYKLIEGKTSPEYWNLLIIIY